MLVLYSHVLINWDCIEFYLLFWHGVYFILFFVTTCEFYLEQCQTGALINSASDKQVIYHIDLKQIEYIFMEIYVSNTNILGGWKK